MWDLLPEYALIELPGDLVVDLQAKADHVKDFGFVYEDLVDDCLSNITHLEMAEESLEMWFDEIAHELNDNGLDNERSRAYLDSVNNLFQSVRLNMNGLYTPSGVHYYSFSRWFDSSTMVLEKRIYEG